MGMGWQRRREVVFGEDRPGTCFGCGPANPRGLGLRFFETDEGVEVGYEADEDLAGAPGIVHGGIQATLLDEALCMTIYAKEGVPAVTGELTVRYLRPLPSRVPIVVRSQITERRGKSFFAQGEILVVGREEVVTRARARLFPMPDDTDD